MRVPPVSRPQPTAAKGKAPSRAAVRPVPPWEGRRQERWAPQLRAAPMQGVLQRKCACGTSKPGGGTSAGCAGEIEAVLQRELSIGSSSDPLEHEADRVADQVLAMRAPTEVQRSPMQIQRAASPPPLPAERAPESVHRVIGGSGRPLDRGVRQDMEQRFGHDFSAVRIHQGADAALSAREVSARAYTVGSHIVFAAGRFQPESSDGRRLLAHELTHVVQQDGSPHLARLQRDAAFVPGTVQETTNLADNFFTDQIKIIGHTTPILNGTEAEEEDPALQAIKAPTIQTLPNEDGTVSAWVAQVPCNEGSFATRLPSAGPWLKSTDKAALVTAIGGAAPEQCKADGVMDFCVRGTPTDADFAADVKSHENIHADDLKNGFAAVIGDWDAKLEKAKEEKTIFQAASKFLAVFKLTWAMGGDHNDIMRQQLRTWNTLGAGVHERGKTVATGGAPRYFKPDANADCSEAWIFIK